MLHYIVVLDSSELHLHEYKYMKTLDELRYINATKPELETCQNKLQ